MICEIGRKECVVVVLVELGRLRVALYVGWAILNILRAVRNVLESCLNSLGLILECMISNVGMVVSSWFGYKRNVV